MCFFNTFKGDICYKKVTQQVGDLLAYSFNYSASAILRCLTTHLETLIGVHQP